MTFLNPRYEGLLRLDSVTCVIDAVGIFADGDNSGLNMLKLRQIGYADLVVLNKTDLVGVEHLEVIREWIGLHKQPVRIIETTYSDIPLEILLGTGRFDAEAVTSPSAEGGRAATDSYADAHSPTFDRWSYRTAKPFSLEALRLMVQRELPESIYRCKGVIYAADRPDTRLSLQVVGGRTQITNLDIWGERPRISEIVAVGGDINRDQLDNLFGACLAGPAVT